TWKIWDCFERILGSCYLESFLESNGNIIIGSSNSPEALGLNYSEFSHLETDNNECFYSSVFSLLSSTSSTSLSHLHRLSQNEKQSSQNSNHSSIKYPNQSFF